MALSMEAIRKDRGLNQKQVADKLGINLPKYIAWEGLSKEDLEKVAAVLKVNPKEIRIPK